MPLLEPGIKFSHKTSSGLVLTGNGKLYGFSIKANNQTVGEAIIYDNTSGSGTIIDEIAVAADNDSRHVTFTRPVDFSTGLYFALTDCVGTLYFMDGAYA